MVGFGFEYLDNWLQGGAILLVVIVVLLMVLYLAKTLQRGRVNVSVVFFVCFWFLLIFACFKGEHQSLSTSVATSEVSLENELKFKLDFGS